MQIINITNKEQLNNFVGVQKHSQFLQSWQWGEFHKIVSGKVFKLAIKYRGGIAASAVIIKKVLPMGKAYFYCPRGPVINQLLITNEQLRVEIIEFLFNEIENLARKECVMFFRFDPVFKIKDSNLPFKKTIDVQPSQTSILNLKKTEEELLKAMHQKTRYNIRLADKKGVKIIQGSLDKFDEFWKLMCETSDRDSFRSHGMDYYKEMLELGDDFIKLFFAKHQGKIISAVIVSFFGDTAAYMHGASSGECRDVMSPYALQWHCIKLAKELGYKYYDFYGVDEKKWPGVTRFKKGFSGKITTYPGTFDFVFDKSWYNVYKMVRKARRTF